MPSQRLHRNSDQWTAVRGGALSSAIITGAPYFGFPVYTETEKNSWTTSAPGYTGLAASSYANSSYTVTDLGTAVTDSTGRTAILDQSVRAKTLAGLWKADGDTAKYNKAVELLDAVKDITSYYTGAGVAQDGLEASWWIPNYVQAAAILGYSDTNFKNGFCRGLVYNMLDWTAGCNWFATFTSGRLQIAAYLADTTLWNDAMAYLGYTLPRTIFHSTYDGTHVVPIRSGGWPAKLTGAISAGYTVGHWGGYQSHPQIGTTTSGTQEAYLATYDSTFGPSDTRATAFTSGTDGERLRDISHQCMTLAGFTQALRTVRAAQQTVTTEFYDRLHALADYHGGRVLYYLQNGTFPTPVPFSGAGGTGYIRSWYGVRAFFGNDTPANVTSLLARSEITGASAAGVNHMTCELFMDRNPYG